MKLPLFWVSIQLVQEQCKFKFEKKKKILYFLKLSPELISLLQSKYTHVPLRYTFLIPIVHLFLCAHFSLQCCQEAMTIYFYFFAIIPPWLILLIITMFRMTSFLVSAERHNQIQLIGKISSLLDWQNIAILKIKFFFNQLESIPQERKSIFLRFSSQ